MFNKLLFVSLLATPSLVSGSESNVYGYIDIVANKTDSENNHNGVDNSLSLYPNSSLMLGGRYKITEFVSAQAQIVATGDINREPTGFVDIASLTFKTPYDSNIAIGKQRLPINMLSRKTFKGIDTTWITLPESVYDRQIPNTYIGASANYTFQWRDIYLESTLYAGNADAQVRQTHNLPELYTDSKYTNIVGGSVFVANKPVKYFASYMQGEHRSEIDEMALLRLSSEHPLMNDSISQQALDDSDVELIGFGLNYEVSPAVTFSAEVLDKRFESGLINSTFGYYASVAYKFRELLLTATLSEEQFRDDRDKLSDLQTQFILTGSYQVSPKVKVATEYTHTNSKVQQNPNFESRLIEEGINQFSLSVHYRF